MPIGTSNNTIATRIQLKSDTETNWITNPITPLDGEIIIYSADNTHNFSRIKIGDGKTDVSNLPFVDAGSLKGNTEIVYKYNSRNNFPQNGSTSCLYLDLSTNLLYHYDIALGYKPIYSGSAITIHDAYDWGPGSPTEADIQNNTLVLINGTAPKLYRKEVQVLTI